jgi:hypothetical protein
LLAAVPPSAMAALEVSVDVVSDADEIGESRF